MQLTFSYVLMCPPLSAEIYSCFYWSTLVNELNVPLRRHLFVYKIYILLLSSISDSGFATQYNTPTVYHHYETSASHLVKNIQTERLSVIWIFFVKSVYWRNFKRWERFFKSFYFFISPRLPVCRSFHLLDMLLLKPIP